MIEIKPNIRGDITVRETEDATGIGTYWIFEDLQNYVINFHPDKEILHHLCLLSLYQMERVQLLSLKEAEIFRLDSDLERLIKNLYYTDTMRNFDADIKNEQIELYEDGNIVQTFTLMRFEEDLAYEPDPFENAKQLINFALEDRKLNDEERNKLANKIVKLYTEIKEKEIVDSVKPKKH